MFMMNEKLYIMELIVLQLNGTCCHIIPASKENALVVLPVILVLQECLVFLVILVLLSLSNPISWS
jgi:hypothetical protein